jgi:lipid II:glycine glycyltransferase (peptidoglycan interpeptide bridge formation enzyme)
MNENVLLIEKSLMPCTVRLVTDLRQWGKHFSQVPMPFLEQSAAYGEMKRKDRKLRITRYAFDIDGSTVAICQVLTKYCCGIRIASRIERGPLFLDTFPSWEVRRSVLHAIRRRWKTFGAGPMEIQPALDNSAENCALLADLGFLDMKTQPYWSTAVDLQPEVDTIRSRLAPKWRNQLKKAEQGGLAFRSSRKLDDLEWMLDRHTENMLSKGFQHPSRAMLKLHYFEDPANFHIMQAICERQPIAGIVVVKFGQKAEYYVGWFGTLGRKFNSGNFLLWNAALEMKKAGCVLLDLRGLNPDHKYTDFKLGMRGAEYRLLGKWLSI